MLSVTGKERREVPLPSQEGKKGVMQYALYVPRPLGGRKERRIVNEEEKEEEEERLTRPGRRSTRWPTGPVKALSGP